MSPSPHHSSTYRVDVADLDSVADAVSTARMVAQIVVVEMSVFAAEIEDVLEQNGLIGNSRSVSDQKEEVYLKSSASTANYIDGLGEDLLLIWIASSLKLCFDCLM